MTGIISSMRMSEIDSAAQHDYGIPESVLMENAGLKGWQYIEREILPEVSLQSRDGSVLFAAGGGNNGGDALVMARHAFEKYPGKVLVVSVSEKRNSTAEIQLGIVKALGIPVLRWPDDRPDVEAAASSAAVIIDGITGTGIKGPLRESSAGFVDMINMCGGFKVAVDIPSGAGDFFKAGYPCFKADETLVFGLPRFAHYLPLSRTFCGSITVINPGFPSALISGAEEESSCSLYGFDDFTLPRFEKNAYKNSRGHAAVFAGSEGYTGAAVLSAAAAAGTRTGLVSLYVDDDVYPQAASFYPFLMVHPASSYDLTGLEDKFSSFLCGPGWGHKDRRDVLETVLDSRLPGVVDADGIRVLKELKELSGFTGSGRIITPHPGELSAFLDVPKNEIAENPFGLIKDAAEKYDLVVVLKMHVVYIASPEGLTAVIDGMNPALGTAGSGDVLAGIIAGILAQGVDPYKAAVSGVLLHQQAGMVCYEERGWFNAEDLVSSIPSVIKDAGF